eukprot:SAG31_NODE_9567_length_1258_cov_1.289905_2_plen_133_part_00
MRKQNLLYQQMKAEVSRLKTGKRDGLRLHDKTVQKELDRRGVQPAPAILSFGSSQQAKLHAVASPKKLRQLPSGGPDAVLSHLLADGKSEPQASLKERSASAGGISGLKDLEGTLKLQMLEDMELQYSCVLA